MSSSDLFVPLDRRFRPAGGEGDIEEIATESIFGDFVRRPNGSVGWDEILDSSGAIVILGEPGSGRTEEFKHQQRSLLNQKKASFYVPLHELAHREMEAILLDQNLANYKSWRRGKSHCWIFLDAVDEAKLESNRAWESALKNVFRSTGMEALKRCTILISCRVHQWDPTLDPIRITEALNLSPSSENGSEGNSDENKSGRRKLNLFLLEPLDETRIRAYALACDTVNVDQFIEAIRKGHCWEFAGRPYDVKFLLQYWKSRGQLGSLSEMIDHLVDYQLTEHRADSRREFDIPREKLRVGAETLGAASIFCNRLHFRTSILESGNGQALLVAKCLPGDWTEVEIETLLDRPLFTAASLGKIRFHHRRTAEYLAVCWIRKRSAELSNLDFDHLLFSRYHGRHWLRESRESVATWLACLSQEGWGQHLRSKLTRISPESFFRKGDPVALSSQAKVEIIDSFVANYEQHDVFRLSTEASVVERLGDATMAARLAHHLQSPNVPPGVKIEILSIATTLRLKECLQAALFLVASDTNRLDLPGYAIHLIEVCAGSEELDALATQVTAMPQVTPHLAASLVLLLFPDRMEVSVLEDLVRRSALFGDRFFLEVRIREKVSHEVNRELLSEIARMLIRLIYDGASLDNELLVPGYCWLHDAITAAFSRLCGLQGLSRNEIELAGQMMWILLRRSIRHSRYHRRTRQDAFDMDQIPRIHPLIRREAFWREVEFQRRLARRNEPRWSDEGENAYSYKLDLNPQPSDLAWSLLDAGEMTAHEDRDCAFGLAVHLWLRCGRSKKVLVELGDLAQGDIARSEFLVKTRGSLKLRRFRNFWFKVRRVAGLDGNYWYHKKWRFTSSFNEVRSCLTLLRHLAKVRDGSFPLWIYDLCREGSDSDSRYITEDLSHLESVYSKKVGRLLGWRIRKAAEEGCIKIWESHTPEIAFKTIFGIPGAVGIQILWKRGNLHFSELSPQEADRCSRYSLQEINGFPPWFPDLVSSQPWAVRSVLVEQIVTEWFYHDENSYLHVLYQLDHDDQPLTSLLAPAVKLLLSRSAPRLFKVLEAAIPVLARAESLSHGEWSQLASERCDRLSPGSPSFTLWLSVWIQTDALGAFTFIEALRVPFFAENRQNNFVVSLCSQLLGRRGRSGLIFDSPEFLKSENVEQWIRCVYEWVREEDDLHRPSGVGYTPTGRDDAQTYRGNLVAAVAEIDDPAVDHILDSLINDLDFSASHNYFRYLGEKRARRFADQETWTERQFRQFSDEREANPASAQALFEVILRRFFAIKHDVEDAEESIRDYFNVDRNEYGLQSFLTRQLRDRNNFRYTVPRETEIDGQQRTDIQIHAPQVRGHIQIEVKLASMANRTAASLESDLEHQLLGQYMRDPDSNFGIFAVGLAQGRNSWRHPHYNEELTFPALIEHLLRRAAELESATGRAKRIEVIGIDFRERGAR